ncbi:MAG TPA: PQQ-binding-like beta-propeller repeat protein [Bryobacteraceae bacterium]|nr:PQQ-binding-like beta-propeller repeat protein [Bryobacteraceae bacterium]
MYYLTETDPRGSMGLGGKEEDSVGSRGSFVTAIDYKTGRIAWRRESAGAGGLLTTAGKLLFAGDGSSLVAYDVVTGKPLWHARIGGTSNAPETYMLDGHQYVTVAVGDMIVAFVMN